MIDGLGEPPGTWFTLGHKLRELLGTPVWFFDRDNPQIIRQMRAETPGTKIIAVGHSLGAFKVAELSQKIPMHCAVLVDCVRPNWIWWPFTAKKPVSCFASHNVNFQKTFGLPPAVGLVGGDTVRIDAGHDSIIAASAPAIVDFVLKSV